MKQSNDLSNKGRVATSPRRRARKAEAAPNLGAGVAAHGVDVEQHIYQTVFDSVLNQRLVPGTKLPEPALCELFKVSRAVIRKVLQRLEHDRIVELRPNKGAVIAAPTPEETRQIFEARRALEVSIVEIAARRRTAQDLADLRQLLASEHELTQNPYQPTWAACAREFHLRIAAVADNPILTAYLTELMTRCSLIVALYQPLGNTACEHAEHGRIVDYMEKGDVASARAEMGRHLRALEDNISLDRSGSTQTLAQMLNLG
ncbi:GntR family transcriptional regulator [Novosphingobium sp. PY1]|uniref:GntR family transcriptional regulator n=1 Tax=Novosphingobium sp. PY1 TaxID=1882221 RepID=UPI001A903E73|nr:GntR family transcriptional regulator [Novosphingobium sp. PY1]GFM28804.1 GntR family transcriptional regulator [Novosphingobium sp. PY1]